MFSFSSSSSIYFFSNFALILSHVRVTGFGLMIGFTGLFDMARDYTLQSTVTHTSVHIHVFTAVAW
jgi:hypothetical protein